MCSGDYGAESVGSSSLLPVIISVSLLVAIALIITAVVAISLAAVFVKKRRTATHQPLSDSTVEQEQNQSTSTPDKDTVV